VTALAEEDLSELSLLAHLYVRVGAVRFRRLVTPRLLTFERSLRTHVTRWLCGETGEEVNRAVCWAEKCQGSHS